MTGSPARGRSSAPWLPDAGRVSGAKSRSRSASGRPLISAKAPPHSPRSRASAAEQDSGTCTISGVGAISISVPSTSSRMASRARSTWGNSCGPRIRPWGAVAVVPSGVSFAYCHCSARLPNCRDDRNSKDRTECRSSEDRARLSRRAPFPGDLGPARRHLFGRRIWAPAPRPCISARPELTSATWLKACGKLPSMRLARRVVFLCEQADIVGEPDQAIEQRARLLAAGPAADNCPPARNCRRGMRLRLRAARRRRSRCRSAAPARPGIRVLLDLVHGRDDARARRAAGSPRAAAAAGSRRRILAP